MDSQDTTLQSSGIHCAVSETESSAIQNIESLTNMIQHAVSITEYKPLSVFHKLCNKSKFIESVGLTSRKPVVQLVFREG
ncbi:hypothetical protein HK098_003444, partial [Nowakowskiella sp. JEL0407]